MGWAIVKPQRGYRAHRPTAFATREKNEIQRAARFVNNQRYLYKQGQLSDRQKEELSKLAHWTWDASSTHQRPVLKRPAAGTRIKRPAAAE